MVKPWLIGESNPLHDDPQYALYPHLHGCSGWRMCHLVLEMKPLEYLEAFERRDLLVGKWSAPRARAAATKMLVESVGAPLVLLGAKVAAAFTLDFNPFTDRDFPIQLALPIVQRVLMLPHPSGLNRMWHEPGAFARARAAVQRLCQVVTT